MAEIVCPNCGLAVTVTLALPQSTPIGHPADYAQVDHLRYDWTRLCLDGNHGGVLIACPHMRDAIKIAFEAGQL
jgi:hypothetical protein